MRDPGEPSAPPAAASVRPAASRGPDPAAWRPGPNREATAASLAVLAESLRKMPADDAVALIRDFLASGRDQVTGMDLAIEAGNHLTAWPSLRVFLLDQLAAIDPTAAAEISTDILATPTTPDEWAVAMRNIGRTAVDSETRAMLRSKTEELIRDPKWRERPTVGYLNAFDILVHVGAVESQPLLSSLVCDKARRDLAHASFLTLDRLVQRQPAAMLRTLAVDDTLHAARPEMTAQMFARADLRDAAQQQVLREWLLAPTRTALELDTFAASFPNNNQMVSQNLLTSDLTWSGADLLDRDRKTLAILREWRIRPEFAPLAARLATAEQRLLSMQIPPESQPPAKP